MLKHTLRSARTNLIRQALAAVSIVLGVAFITGTFILTDGASSTMDTQVTNQLHGTVAGISALADDPLAPDLLTRVRETEGVAAAEGSIMCPGDLAASTADPGSRPPTGWILTIPVSPDLSAYAAETGHLPTASGEAIIDTLTAEDYGFQVGRPVNVSAPQGTITYTLVGTVDMSGTLFGSRPTVGLTPDDALEASGAKGFRDVYVSAVPGTDSAALVERLSGISGDTTKVLDHDLLVERTLNEVYQDIDSIRKLLLLFVAVAVIAAGFVIANTFTIVLAQRSREIALLRLVGASRGQVFGGVLVEAAIVGVAASLVGLVAGIGVAAGLGRLIGVFGMPIGGDLAIEPRTLLIAFAAGIAVTVGSAMLPAWRGTRVAPVAALSEAAVEVARPIGRVRIAVGATLLVISALALVFAGSVPQVGAIGVCGFFGLVAVGPVLVPVLARVVGWPITKLGASAKLAVSYTARNRRRVAATTTTLVLAVSLVSSVMIGAYSIKAGLEREADKQFGADYVVSGSAVPDALVAELRTRPEFDVVHEQRTGNVDGTPVVSADPAILARMSPEPIAGELDGLRDGTAALAESLATERNLGVGDTVQLGTDSYAIVAVIEDGAQPGAVYLSEADTARLLPDVPVKTVQLTASEGTDSVRAGEVVRDLAGAYPTLSVMDLAAYKETRTAGLSQLLVTVIALLGLAAVIALVGIANTLSLSVAERTREHGVLRAVGVGRRGLRAMLSVEAMLVAFVGAGLGLLLGIAVAAGTIAIAGGSDSARLEVPLDQIGGVLAVVVAAALAASVLPARKAVRGSIVAALADE